MTRPRIALAGATLLLAGCGAGSDPDICAPPPKVECKSFVPPSGGWPEDVSEKQAAAIAIGVRQCANVIGAPAGRLRELFGKPQRNGARQFWYPVEGLRIAARFDDAKRTTAIELIVEYRDSSRTARQYCGEPRALPQP